MTAKNYVLLDRDGTIIHERHYLASPDGVELLPGAAEGLRMLQQAGYGLIVVTNQSGIGRGYLTEDTLAEIHAVLERLLAAEHVQLDGILYCPHTPQDNCGCRKPQLGMLQRAAELFHFDPARAIMIGDKPADIELGRRGGMKTILVRSGYGREHELAGLKADLVCDDLTAAAKAILSNKREGPMSTFTATQTATAATPELTLIEEHIACSVAAKQAMGKQCGEVIVAIARAISDSLRNGGKLLLCGNGGSAADCQHIAAEYVSSLNHRYPRPGLASIALTTDTSILTANANDFGFEGVFARQVEALGRPGDVLIGLSTSGNSENVCRAVMAAKENGILTVAMTGESGGKLAGIADMALKVPASNVMYIQECHLVAGHLTCALVERHLFPGLHGEK